MTIRLPIHYILGISQAVLHLVYHLNYFLFFNIHHAAIIFLSFAFLNIECKREVLHANVAASGHSLTALVWACH